MGALNQIAECHARAEFDVFHQLGATHGTGWPSLEDSLQAQLIKGVAALRDHGLKHDLVTERTHDIFLHRLKACPWSAPWSA
mmetsp:Transcript_234/g.454  ORF Transcript_234/g.454 Transcript_234/m.454 type:complete len:82 (-) Transcript_234:39-284(-)